MAKKSSPGVDSRPANADEELVAVTLEPKAGKSDKSLVATLKQVGAREVEILSPGFISARAPSSGLDRLRGIAEVHAKTRKQTR